MIVEIIQPNLAPGNDLWPLCQLRHLLEIGIAGKLGLVRMNSDGRINELVLFGELDAAVERPWTGSAANGENRFDSGFAGASEHLLTVGIELLHLEMCVGIDEDRSLVVGHWLCGDGRLARQGRLSRSRSWLYFNLVPTGTSSRKPASTAFPPSGDAATIIPFDSSPRSFLGARFATITTFLPINNSGAYDSAIPATTWRTSVPKIDFQAEQLVRTFHFLGRLDLPYAQFDLREIIDADLAVRHGRGRLRCRRWSRRRGRGRSCHRMWCCVRLRFGRRSASLLFFHLLHPFNCALVGAREYGFNIAQLRSQLELSPLQLRERKLANVTQSKLRPDPRSRVGNHRMCQCGHDAQRFGAGVQNGSQARAAFFILLFTQRPRLIFDNIFVDRRHQSPCNFQSTRELVLIKQRAVLGDHPARCSQRWHYPPAFARSPPRDTAPRRENIA